MGDESKLQGRMDHLARLYSENPRRLCGALDLAGEGFDSPRLHHISCGVRLMARTAVFQWGYVVEIS